MLGHLRFLFAVFVVFSHLAGLVGGMPTVIHWGTFSVFGFYLISGYLITRILHQTYSFRFVPFALNRWLRLFPAYYVVAIATVVTLFLAPSPADFHKAWEIRLKPLDIAGNALIVPFEFYDAPFRLVPVAWSLAVELVNYFLLWLIVARSWRFALVSLAVALAYHVFSGLAGAAWTSRYYPWYAALLPFSLGALVHFAQERIGRTKTVTAQWLVSCALVAWLANLLLCGVAGGIEGRFFSIFFYGNLVSLLVLIACLTHPRFSRLRVPGDRILGDLAYPVFLLHWIVGFCVLFIVPPTLRFGIVVFALSLPIIVGVAYLLVLAGDRFIEPVRDLVRDSLAARRSSSPTARHP